MARYNSLIAAAVIAVIAGVGAQAKANPVSIGGSADGSPIYTLATGPGAAGVTAFTYNNYTISLSATGSPALIDPNFGSNTLSIQSSGGGTVTLYASEINNTALVPSFTIGLSNNPLSDTSVSEAFYADVSNQFYGMGTLLASATLNPGDTQSVVAPFGALSAPYSITEVYTIHFGAAGGSVNATILEKANVPEPMSISLLGAGLAGLGFVRLRRQA